MRFTSSQHGWMPGSVLAVALALVLIAAGPAAATMPGTNGKIAFSSDRNGDEDLWVMSADGTGQALLQSDPSAQDFYPAYPAWSPDGRDIAFTREYDTSDRLMDLFVIEADGGNVRQATSGNWSGVTPTWSPDGRRIAFGEGAAIFVTTAPPSDEPVQLAPRDISELDAYPDWSPDGDLIVFTRTKDISPTSGHARLYVVDSGGGQAQPLTTGNTEFDLNPSISPDGQTVVFTHSRFSTGQQSDLYTVPITGGTPTQLTTTPGFDEADPAWSPDGTKIAFGGKENVVGADWEIYTINADGSGRTPLTTSPGNDTDPSWQRIVTVGYARPKGASPIRVALVPAYDECTAPNRTHGPPLAFGSCGPPDQASDFATVGTADANGQQTKSVGSLALEAIVGDPDTPADEADVRIRVSITDVRVRGATSTRYPWSLYTSLPIRLTDNDNGCCGFPATVVDEFDFRVETPCGPGPSSSDGSTCAVTTTADSLIPGTVREGRRATWQMHGPVRVYDAGPDAGGQDSTLFATQGIFVP